MIYFALSQKDLKNPTRPQLGKQNYICRLDTGLNIKKYNLWLLHCFHIAAKRGPMLLAHMSVTVIL